jgi:uncharacterized protein with HEPN domain
MQRDEAYLLDILIAARKAIRFTRDLSWQEFESSELHQDAVLRSLEVVGEAARLVSQEFRDSHPNIPWTDIIGMRNRIIHEYFRVNLAAVWDTIQNDLPILIEQIEPLVPPEDKI